jgi:hypothetical protein
MAKRFIPIFISLLTLMACTNHYIDKELVALRKENAFLRKKIRNYDNSIVITRDNIGKYIGALAYGPAEAKKNETISIECCLYLHDFPVKVVCRMDQENQSVKDINPVTRRIENSFPGSGERVFSGLYTVTFPNREEWEIPWEKRVVIK